MPHVSLSVEDKLVEKVVGYLTHLPHSHVSTALQYSLGTTVEGFNPIPLLSVAQKDQIEVGHEHTRVAPTTTHLQHEILHIGLEQQIHQLVTHVLLVDLLENSRFPHLHRRQHVTLGHLLVEEQISVLLLLLVIAKWVLLNPTETLQP
jgi:hypothetical protein